MGGKGEGEGVGWWEWVQKRRQKILAGRPRALAREFVLPRLQPEELFCPGFGP